VRLFCISIQKGRIRNQDIRCKKMTKKIIVGTVLLAGVVFLSTGLVFASEDAKPWESMTKFRGGDEVSAQDLEMTKEEFHAYRDEIKEEHRESRMEKREERLQAAVDRGCITEDEMETRMQIRKGRFSK
jgi:hypothetical protein